MKNKVIGGVLAALIAIGVGLTQLGVLPWATAKSVDHLIALKNQDNQWYRELDVKVGKMESDISHIMDSVKRIERKLDGEHH